jgi:PAS domain S-box-containing protein
MEHTKDSVLASEYREIDSLIGELQRVNSELALQKEMYQTLSRVSPVGMFRTDPWGKVEYINSKGLDLLGLSKKEFVLDRNWANLVCEEDRKKVSSKWDRCVKEQTNFVVECRFQQPDGKTVWTLCQANLVNGGGRGHVGTITDITPQKEILTKLVALKEKRTSRCLNGK